MTKRKRDRAPQSATPNLPVKRPAPRTKRPVPKGKVHRSGRQLTVYDAVASRASYEGFIKSTLRKNGFGEHYRRSQRAYPADEVLGRRKHAPEEPIPYAEGQVDVGLPDSDLLIAIHQYAADFYAANGMGPVSYRTLDETALLAAGIYIVPPEILLVAGWLMGKGMLLEETARSCLGEGGDLVFIEPEEEIGENNPKRRSRKSSSRGRSINEEKEEERIHEEFDGE